MNKDYTNMCFIGICFVFQYVLDVLTKNIFVKVMWLSLLAIFIHFLTNTCNSLLTC